MDTSKQIGPFVYGENLVRRFDYTLGVALAYNAFGLIGPEKNGIFILDHKRMAVVLDDHYKESSGYYGVSKAQHKEMLRIMKFNKSELVNFILQHPNTRDDYRDWIKGNSAISEADGRRVQLQ